MVVGREITMTGWHFHWGLAPIIFLAGILIGVIFAPNGSTAAPSTEVPIEVAVALPAEPVASTEAPPGNPDGPIGEIEDAASEGSMYRTQIPVAAKSQDQILEDFTRERYQECVDANLIGDRCRQIFYPSGPAEEAQAAQWRREAAPAVEAQTRWLSQYNERQIRENSRYQ
jgi:hypothetical protein